MSEKFLGQRNAVAAESVLTHQQPSCQSFFDLMRPIARSDLCGLALPLNVLSDLVVFLSEFPCAFPGRLFCLVTACAVPHVDRDHGCLQYLHVASPDDPGEASTI